MQSNDTRSQAQPIDPLVAAKLDTLTPKARERYEVMAAGWREEWALERVHRAELAASLVASPRARLWRWMTDVADDVLVFGSIGCAIVFGAAVVAGACGTFVGVLVALIRAGWRAGASL